ncbi:MAG: DUF3841 domain-containing protein [Chitinophagaceae bacterium]|nr:DUF3841 domain-containing protein [Chitinophagaceae bacterium]
MILWTIQSEAWYAELLQKGIIHGTRKHAMRDGKFSLFAYHWLMDKMEESIGRRPFRACYPVWAWYQHMDSKRRKPDLRRAGFLTRGTKGVRVEINKDDKDVLLSDFILWHFPFSYRRFIGQNEGESMAFEKMLEDNGLDTKKLEELPKDIQNVIIKSWDRTLDMDFSDPYHTSPKASKSIQATFWTLSVDEIVRVDKFISR